MCRRSLIWCILLVTSLAKSPSNFTRDDDQMESIPYKPHMNFTKDKDENIVRIQYNSSHMTKNDKEDKLLPYEIRINSMNSTLDEFDLSQNSSVVYEVCDRTQICIQLCCPRGQRLHEEKCVVGKDNYIFPEVYENATNSMQSDKMLNDSQMFQLINRDPCYEKGRYSLNPTDYPEDEFMILTNGSLYRPHNDNFMESTSYCLGVLDEEKYDVLLCFEDIDNNETITEDYQPGVPVGLIVSLPFLLMTFVVYTVLSELQNMHGYTLRGYVGSLFIAYIILAVLQLSPQNIISDRVCIVLAFVIYFSFLASFFWLNVMCFDIWWTFGGFRSLQGSVKQRERKKFIIYSIYAWGCASILTIVCAIMDFVPSVSKDFIRPEFGAERCWFASNTAKALYFYGPMGVTVFCNICLFISTAVKIVQHKKDTAHHLRSSESRRHDDNKQWFNLYLKLFIVMGINWSMEIISWIFRDAPDFVWYITDLTNTLQGLIIFIIFVWKGKIKRLLLKRFGCQERGLFSRNSTRSAYHSSASRTCTTTTTGVIPLQEKINYVQTNCRAKSSSEDIDCP